MLRHVLSVFCGRRRKFVSGHDDVGAWRLALAIAHADESWPDCLARCGHDLPEPPLSTYDRLLLAESEGAGFLAFNVAVADGVRLSPAEETGTRWVPPLREICESRKYPKLKLVVDLLKRNGGWMGLPDIEEKVDVSDATIRTALKSKPPLFERRQAARDRRITEYRLNPQYPQS